LCPCPIGAALITPHTAILAFCAIAVNITALQMAFIFALIIAAFLMGKECQLRVSMFDLGLILRRQNIGDGNEKESVDVV
jgi:hypothetical protein